MGGFVADVVADLVAGSAAHWQLGAALAREIPPLYVLDPLGIVHRRAPHPSDTLSHGSRGCAIGHAIVRSKNEPTAHRADPCAVTG